MKSSLVCDSITAFHQVRRRSTHHGEPAIPISESLGSMEFSSHSSGDGKSDTVIKS